jgi:hypothetical protein
MLFGRIITGIKETDFMLMSSSYTLSQVAQDLKDILAKKRDMRRTTTQERSAIKPHTSLPATHENSDNHDAS